MHGWDRALVEQEPVWLLDDIDITGTRNMVIVAYLLQ